MTMPSAAPADYPVHLAARPPERLSTGLWLVKWLLIIPHVIVLIPLWVVFVLLTVVAFVAILVTGRYPRGIFDFNVGVLRWTWRVSYYAYSALATDLYPPFTLAEMPDYPASLSVEYPERLSRGLVLVKWWLLALPQYVVIGLLTGPQVGYQTDQGTRYQGQIGLIGILVLVAAVLLAVRGTYPRHLYDLVLGLNRWVFRVTGYVCLMTDVYPPFRLDQGPEDRATAVDLTPTT
ncbi:MAG: DUF4389 domain-containing protein [Cellulomonas sp.]